MLGLEVGIQSCKLTDKDIGTKNIYIHDKALPIK